MDEERAKIKVCDLLKLQGLQLSCKCTCCGERKVVFGDEETRELILLSLVALAQLPGGLSEDEH